MKFFRFNYQLLWEQQDQESYIHFPRVLTETELLPYIITNEHRHLHYRDPNSFNVNYFEQIILDHNFTVEHSETSDNRPYTTSNTPSETTLEEHNLNTIPQYTRQNTVQLNQDDSIDILQTQEPQQLNPIPAQQQQDTATLQLDPSETATIQDASELSEETVHNTQSFTITNDSNLIQIPIHDI